MIKVLGINGSPRKYGNTYKALMLALEGAKNEGAEVKLVNLYDLKIEHCMGCISDNIKSCKYPCPIDDDMKKLQEEVLKSDVLIIATPIYWYNVSSALKAFIDRLTVFENMIVIEGRSWVEGKIAGFIAIGNDTGAIAVIQNLMVTFNSMGFIIPPWALAYYTEMGDVTESENAVLDAVNVGRVTVIMAKVIKGLERPPKVWYRADAGYRNFALKKAREVREFVLDRLTS